VVCLEKIGSILKRAQEGRVRVEDSSALIHHTLNERQVLTSWNGRGMSGFSAAAVGSRWSWSNDSLVRSLGNLPCRPRLPQDAEVSTVRLGRRTATDIGIDDRWLIGRDPDGTAGSLLDRMRRAIAPY
jgi:hypothetical protein